VPPLPPVNVNRASLRELQRIPGIGLTIGRKLVAYREQHGPIQSIEQLRQLDWWTRQAQQAEPYLCFE